jgi:LysM repeat protein
MRWPPEARRRGLLPPKQDQKGDASAGRSMRQRRPGLLAKNLAPGKVNAIRAASQAGVKLSKIAQEFGLPLATVKRVIAGSAAS